MRADLTQNSPLRVGCGKQWPLPRPGGLTEVTELAEKQEFWPLRSVRVWVGVCFTNVCVVGAFPIRRTEQKGWASLTGYQRIYGPRCRSPLLGTREGSIGGLGAQNKKGDKAGRAFNAASATHWLSDLT